MSEIPKTEQSNSEIIDGWYDAGPDPEQTQAEQSDSPVTDWQMEAWLLDTRLERHEVAGHIVADNLMTLESGIKALQATFPEPHFVIVTPTVELQRLRDENRQLRIAARHALDNTDMEEIDGGCECPACSAVRRLREVVG